jgi:DNA-binding transcriptional regulator YdaS (Cro superfamily)
MSKNPVSKAIESVGLQELARRLGVTYQAVRKWERARAPAERCHDIVAATQGAVTLHELRPDLWPEQEQQAGPRERAA